MERADDFALDQVLDSFVSNGIKVTARNGSMGSPLTASP